jgi:hypothetical protein
VTGPVSSIATTARLIAALLPPRTFKQISPKSPLTIERKVALEKGFRALKTGGRKANQSP